MKNSFFSPKLVEFFDELSSKRDFWIARNKYYYSELQILHKQFIEKGKTVLDIGCGTGDLLNSLSPSFGVGIDFSFEMVKIASHKYPKLHFQVMDAHNLQLDRTFEYVVMSNLVGYSEDIWQVFRELAKVSNRRTQIIITNYNYLWQPFMAIAEKLKVKMPDKIQNWLPQEFIKQFLYLAGFEVVKSGKYLHSPLNLGILGKIINIVLSNIPILDRFALIEYIIARPVFFGAEKHKEIPISIIIPTHNEAGNIKHIVDNMPQIGSKMEMVFVDLPGEDATEDVIKQMIKENKGKILLKYVKQREKTGKIGALRQGILEANGEIIIIYDADATVPPEDLEKVYLALIERKADFINGTRLVYPTEKGAMRFANHLGNTFFAKLFTWSLGQHFTDTLCGTKGFWRQDFMDFEKSKTGYDNFDLFGDFYLLLSAYRKNLRIAEVPVRYKTRRYGDTKMNRLKNGFRFFVMYLYFFWNYKLLRRV